MADGRPGAITFLQRFGSAINGNLHFHSIVPEGVFTEGPDGAAQFHDVPAPEDEDVLAILRKVVTRVHALLARRGVFEEDPPAAAGALATLLAEAAQTALALGPAEPDEPRPRRRTAFVDGYSLHAGTFVHENDRAGLERLARYGARPALSLDRLSRLPDGRIAYRVKRRAPDRAATRVGRDGVHAQTRSPGASAA